MVHCVYDFQKLEKLLGSLYLITGRKIALKSGDGDDIISNNTATEFCQLIQSSAYGYDKCLSCNKQALAHAKEANGAHLYRCQMGLMAAAIPVMENGRLLACLMYGQLLDETPLEEQWAQIERKCRWHQNLPALKRAFGQLDQLNKETLMAYAEVLSACASYIWLHEYVKQSEITAAQHLLQYVEKNYARPLTLGVVCAELGIGKTKLCEMARQNFSATIHELILHCRLDMATQLIATTDQPISRIAEAVGINDCNYFVKLFKANMGTTPLRYKKHLAKHPPEAKLHLPTLG